MPCRTNKTYGNNNNGVGEVDQRSTSMKPLSAMTRLNTRAFVSAKRGKFRRTGESSWRVDRGRNPYGISIPNEPSDRKCRRGTSSSTSDIIIIIISNLRARNFCENNITCVCGKKNPKH